MVTDLDLKFNLYALGKINPLQRKLWLFSVNTKSHWGILLMCTNT